MPADVSNSTIKIVYREVPNLQEIEKIVRALPDQTSNHSKEQKS